MKKTIIKNPRLDEEYVKIKHKSGLTICLYPMKGFSTVYALFGTRYGSVDTTFKTNDDDDYVTVPAGIAHYLEHKLFENEECGAFELFAKTGANANAYTSFDKTAYLFSCSQNTYENLEILLEFVQNPYFTDENVEKEQGIIAQEIKMYDDDPSWRVLFNGLEGVYHNNPVRIDIAGTVESIGKINKELLYRCYNTFYNLNNMSLCIAGDIDVEKTLEICDRLLKPSPDKGLSALTPPEPKEVLKPKVTQKMSCSQPLFTILFKLPNYVGVENVINYIKYKIVLEILFDGGSEFYNKMLEDGIINDSFSAGVFNGRGFFLPCAQGESKDPDKVLSEMKNTIINAQKSGISEKEFKNIKKKTYGQLVMMFNSVEAVAAAMLDGEFNDSTLYDMIETAAKVTLEDINEALNKINADNATLSVVEPI